MNREQRRIFWVVWAVAWALLIHAAYSRPPKGVVPAVSMPMPPGPPTNSVKQYSPGFAAVLAYQQSLKLTNGALWQSPSPNVTSGFVITNLVMKNGQVTIGWSGGGGTNQVQWSPNVSGPWLSFGGPVTGKSLSGPMPGSTALFRVVSTTNGIGTIDLGNSYLDSTSADSMPMAGVTAICSHDFTAPFLITYDQAGVVHRYALTNLAIQDFYNYAEAAFASPDRVVVVCDDWAIEGAEGIVVSEYCLTNGVAALQKQILTGDTNARQPDILRMADGTIVVASTEQGAGYEFWLLHRKPDGTWIDDGLQEVYPFAPAGEPACATRLVERPSDHSVWAAHIHDSWGVLLCTKLELHDKGTMWSTNFTLTSNATSNGQFVDGADMAPHGEIPYFFEPWSDFQNNRVLFAYCNERRWFINVPAQDFTFSLARVALTAWNADGSKQLVGESSSSTNYWEGVTERVYGNFSILPGGTFAYVPLHTNDLQTWPPNSNYQKESGQALLSLSMYDQVCRVRAGLANQQFTDVIGRRADGRILVVR